MVPFSAIICSKTGLTADGLSLLTCADTLNFSCGILPPKAYELIPMYKESARER